jgi:hypothetical protein
VPKKQNVLSDEERRKRLREAARELETSEDPKDFEKAFSDVTGSPKAAGTKSQKGI